MSFNHEILSDKNIAPVTAPDSQGKTRKLGIAPNEFGGDCETMEFKFVAGKGEFLTFNADLATYTMIVNDMELALRKREAVETSYEQEFKNKASSWLTVGRKEDGTPFMRIKATTKSGVERNKEFFFPMPRGVKIHRNGQLLNDLEMNERRCKAFLVLQNVYLEALKDKYKARVWQENFNGGNGGGYGAGKQQQQQSSSYGNNNQAPAQQQHSEMADSEFNDMF